MAKTKDDGRREMISGFYLRLDKRMRELNLKDGDLAKLVDIDARTLTNYKAGNRMVPADVLISMADNLQMSADELLGIEKAPKKNKRDSIDMDVVNNLSEHTLEVLRSEQTRNDVLVLLDMVDFFVREDVAIPSYSEEPASMEHAIKFMDRIATKNPAFKLASDFIQLKELIKYCYYSDTDSKLGYETEEQKRLDEEFRRRIRTDADVIEAYYPHVEDIYPEQKQEYLELRLKKLFADAFDEYIKYKKDEYLKQARADYKVERFDKKKGGNE